jgi:hypothetical protein
MPRINTVDAFPPEVRQMVQRRLYENGFRDYKRIAAELTAAGHPVKTSSLHRFGVKLRAEVKNAEMAALVNGRGV